MIHVRPLVFVAVGCDRYSVGYSPIVGWMGAVDSPLRDAHGMSRSDSGEGACPRLGDPPFRGSSATVPACGEDSVVARGVVIVKSTPCPL